MRKKTNSPNNIRFVAEAFSDRQYEPDMTLRSRQKENAVHVEELQVLQQAEELALHQRVYANGWIHIRAKTLCLHSDTQGAVILAGKIRNHLEGKGIHIAAV